jgi:hypothetical protein
MPISANLKKIQDLIIHIYFVNNEEKNPVIESISPGFASSSGGAGPSLD